jgi:hypothetical protein
MEINFVSWLLAATISPAFISAAGICTLGGAHAAK